MKRTMIILIILTVVMSLLITACQSDDPPVDPVGSQESAESQIPSESEMSVPANDEQEQIMIAAIAAEVGIPFFTTMQWGAMDAARDYNVDLYWTGPPLWDFNAQIPFIDGALALNPDAIMLVPTDNTALITYVEKWMADGIPVISVDSPLSEHVDLVGYSSDKYGGGMKAAEVMFEEMGEGGTYLPVGTIAGAYGPTLRCQGFIDKMAELNPSATMLDMVYPHHDATIAAELVTGAIIGNPDLRGVFVATSAPASGASTAIIENNKAGIVKLAAFDADPQQVADLKDGIYDVLIAQDPYQMGYDAIMNLAKYVRGELSKDDFSEAEVTYPMKPLTRENVDLPENNHYRYIAELPPGY